MPGNAKPPLNPEQRRALDARAKSDVGKFFGAFLGTAARAAGDFLDANPENLVAVALSQPLAKATLATLAARVKAVQAEVDEEADRAEDGARRR